MSTYKLWELANREGVNGLLPYVEEAVLRFQESDSLTLGARTPTEVGEPMARYVHAKLMALARPLRPTDPTPPDPLFTHIVWPPESGYQKPYGDLNMKALVHTMAPDMFSDQEAQTLGTSIGRLLRYHKLAMTGVGTGKACYFIRNWPPNLEWSHTLPHEPKPDHRTEKRITEEADKPVKVYRSAKVVVGEIPEKITPEWAVETVKRMAKAFDDLAERHIKLEEKYVELEARYEEMVTDPWNEAATSIKAVLS